MIRSQELIDKLVADLHFHHYLFVIEGDNIFIDKDENIERLRSLLEEWGLDKKINAHTDFYHGGTVVTDAKIDYIYQFVNDVYIDYFFRTYNFHPIILPKGLCYEQITKDGIIHPNSDVSLNLNDLYDRCTFANAIWRLFGVDKTLLKYFSSNSFINGFHIDKRCFGLHSYCGVLINEIPFWRYLDEYQYKCHHGRAIKPQFRGKEILRYLDFIANTSKHPIYECHPSYMLHIDSFHEGFLKIKDSHLFGNYTIEEILMIYALLTDKFELNEDTFLLSLCFCMQHKIDNKILAAFIGFEESNQDYRLIEPYICCEDLYLRFASHSKSKAFSFVSINNTTDQVFLFNKDPVNLLHYGNSLPLPYLYHKLNEKETN